MTWSEESARATLAALIEKNPTDQVLELATGFEASDDVGAADATTVAQLAEDLGEQWVVETVFDLADATEIEGGTPRDWLGGQPNAPTDAPSETIELEHRTGGEMSTPSPSGGLEPGRDFSPSVGAWDLVGMSHDGLPTFYGPKPDDDHVWTVVLRSLHEDVVAYVAKLEVATSTEEWVTEFAKARLPTDTVQKAVRWMEDHQTDTAVQAFVDDNWGGTRG